MKTTALTYSVFQACNAGDWPDDETSEIKMHDLSGGATTTSGEAVKEGVDRDNIMDASSRRESVPPAQEDDYGETETLRDDGRSFGYGESYAERKPMTATALQSGFVVVPPKKLRDRYWRSDLTNICPTAEAAWFRFCYPALKREAFEKDGWYAARAMYRRGKIIVVRSG